MLSLFILVVNMATKYLLHHINYKWNIAPMNEDLRPQPYSLRIDPEIRAKLESAAKAGNRSLHAEIMMRLETSLQADGTTTIRECLSVEEVREIVREELAKSGK